MSNTFTLNTDAKIPAIGFGTWKVTPDETAKQAVLEALNVGYRLIDTAHIYGNESGVGEALRDSGIAREDLFVTTKLWNDHQGYESALAACDESLRKLGLDYLDLYLIHWPNNPKDRADSWRAFEELHRSGKAKAIGVSNYTIRHLQELKEQSGIVPAVNQVEFHPYIYEQQQELLDYCTQEGILLEAYSPLSRASSDGHAAIEEIAEEIGRSQAQVVLRWCLQHGTLPLPRSTNPEHIRDNFQIFDFQLDDEDMEKLNGISDGQRVTWDPSEIE